MIDMTCPKCGGNIAFVKTIFRSPGKHAAYPPATDLYQCEYCKAEYKDEVALKTTLPGITVGNISVAGGSVNICLGDYSERK